MSDFKVVNVPVEELRSYVNNAKAHPDKQVKAIAQSIQQFGWGQPIEVASDMTIINGHGRYLAAKHLGMKTVPVRVRDDLTETQIRAYRLVDNKVAESDILTDMLTKELAEIHIEFDMSDFFDKRDLEFASVDLGELNLDALTADLSQQVQEQSDKTAKKLEEISEKKVPIAKAFGFAMVTGEQQRYIAMLMSHAESVTEQQGAAALVEFVRDHLGL